MKLTSIMPSEHNSNMTEKKTFNPFTENTSYVLPLVINI